MTSVLIDERRYFLMGLMIGILALVSLAFCAFMFTMYVLRVIGRWRMFKKAGFHG